MHMFSYVDDEDHFRGPFDGTQMHYWYLRGYLQPSLNIFVHQGLFGRRTTLQELVEKNGSSNPFFERSENKVDDVKENSDVPEPSTSDSPYPFLMGCSPSSSERLDESTLKELTTNLQLVKSRYNIKHMNRILENFKAMEVNLVLKKGWHLEEFEITAISFDVTTV
ncbi:hypothetical protein OESDEN_23760 [Oesophagostomum dentatum]|uniref:GYF domain-containing protein n=1 Tax=Oesophagostomum dentatum TaxID=61180 RepID=A0A0B1S0A8_OESDE|nr:hypothetical protein OESDEN_23760 [Oesophagostomum dentatum]